jgi:hypothetical protein
MRRLGWPGVMDDGLTQPTSKASCERYNPAILVLAKQIIHRPGLLSHGDRHLRIIEGAAGDPVSSGVAIRDYITRGMEDASPEDCAVRRRQVINDEGVIHATGRRRLPPSCQLSEYVPKRTGVIFDGELALFAAPEVLVPDFD